MFRLAVFSHTDRKEITETVTSVYHFGKWCFFGQGAMLFPLDNLFYEWKNCAILESGTKMVPKKVLFHGWPHDAPYF